MQGITKIRKPFRAFILTTLMLAHTLSLSARKTITSANGDITFILNTNSEGEYTYSIKHKGEYLIKESLFALTINGDELQPTKESTFKEISSRNYSGEWHPLWGKRAVVIDRYKENVYSFINPNGKEMLFAVRIYNDGVAFRYKYNGDGGVSSTIKEHTNFNFAGNYTAWYYNGERHNIGPEPLLQADGVRQTVMTVKAKDNSYMAIHEASLPATATPMCLLAKAGDTNFTLLTDQVESEGEYRSAWRVIMISDTPGGLVDSHILELLSPEPESDFSWVKPGVALWDWRIDGAEWNGYRYGMNYESWVKMVDFASEQGFSYLVLDANWYGPEFSSDSNPVVGDKARDVQRIILYGKERGVGIWLYLNDVAGSHYPIEQTLEQYERWGAAGVKYGFMNGTPQQKNAKTASITSLCAKHRLLINFHDYPVHPHGQARTWPNAVTREYCQAQLDGHQIFYPKTFVTSVFVNMVAGPIDMNNGFLDLRQGKTTRQDNNQEVPSTVTGEIARTLITYSGATIIPDIPEYYQKYQTLLRFLASQKMPWLESKTLQGEIGEYIVMARQNSEGNYLLAAATNEEGRVIEVPLNFLGKGNWHMEITEDAPDTHYLTNRESYSIRTEIGTQKGTLRLKLAPGGGACVLITRR